MWCCPACGSTLIQDAWDPKYLTCLLCARNYLKPGEYEEPPAALKKPASGALK